MPPGGHQIDKPLRPDVGVKPLDQIGALGGDAPVALAGLAGAAEVTAERQQRRRGDVAGVRAERDRFHHVRRAAD